MPSQQPHQPIGITEALRTNTEGPNAAGWGAIPEGAVGGRVLSRDPIFSAVLGCAPTCRARRFKTTFVVSRRLVFIPDRAQACVPAKKCIARHPSATICM
jgi:hypothetical protein